MRKSSSPLDPDDLVKFDALLTPEPAERRRIIKDELNITTSTFRLHLRDAALNPEVQAAEGQHRSRQARPPGEMTHGPRGSLRGRAWSWCQMSVGMTFVPERIRSR